MESRYGPVVWNSKKWHKRISDALGNNPPTGVNGHLRRLSKRDLDRLGFDTAADQLGKVFDTWTHFHSTVD